MEISVEKTETSDIPKKPRSLDLQSIYVKKSRISNRKSLSRRQVSLSEQESKLSKKKKLRPSFEEGEQTFSEARKPNKKGVASSSLEPGPKRQRNSSNVSKPKHGFNSSIQKKDEPPNGIDATQNLDVTNGSAQCLGSNQGSRLPKKTDRTSSTDGTSRSKSYLNKEVIIPKRPRGISKWRKAKGSVSLETSTNTQQDGLSISECVNSQVLEKKRKKLGEVESNGFHEDDSAPCTSAENDNYTMGDDRKVGNKKNTKITEQTCSRNAAHLVDDPGDSVVDSQDEDEENLEENAARMLSSRFDPNCTSFSGKRTCDPEKDLSTLQSGRDRLKGSQAEACSVDATGRVLRPRRHNGKSFARKRRHFYEVCSRDMDPYCVVKQRIRVFWPLDKSWYFGLVKGYDPVTRLHHVKYDDREEEWINLQNERFKLLLFPSEVSGKFNFGKPGSEPNKKKGEGEVENVDNSYIGSLLESEPIISWLTRTTRPITTSPTRKHLRVNQLKSMGCSLMSASKECMSVNPLDMKPSKLVSNCSEQSQDQNLDEASEQQRSRDSKERKLPYVYFRKRFRNKKDIDMKEIQDASQHAPGDSVGILVDSTIAIDECAKLFLSTKLKGVIFELNLQPQCTLDLAFQGESSWLFRSLYILHYGKLVCAWPVVCMELCFIDNVLGLRFLLFEGCLKCAVSLFCLIITTIDQHAVKSNSTGQETPCSSLGLRISRLNNLSRNLFFVLNLSSKIGSSKWRYLEGKLKRHCKKKALATAEYICSNVQNLPCSEPFYSSIKSHERFWRKSISAHRFNLEKSVDPNSNPVAHYMSQGTEEVSPCSVFLATGSSFSLNLYRNMLIEKDAASGRDIMVYSESHVDDIDVVIANDSSVLDGSLKQSAERHNCLGPSLSQNAACCAQPNIDNLAAGNDPIGGIVDVVKSTGNDNVVQFERSQCEAATSQLAEASCSEYPEVSIPDDGGCSSSINSTKSEVQVSDEAEKNSIRKGLLIARPVSNLVLEMNEHTIHSPTAPRSTWHRNRHTSLSRTFIQRTNLGSGDPVANGFSSGYKRPRTQVSYSHSGGYEQDTKQRSNQQKVQSHKKVKTRIGNVPSEFSKSPQSLLATLTCDANVLVTQGDKCWREFGAKVHLDCDDQKTWRLCVKVSGVTKYAYKAHHVLQPGITNRYTHAMMWKGGKEWTLEFTDRNHWYIFKQMHEECYNQNIRAASVKNIPIPGVRLLFDGDDGCVEVPFVRSSSKYFRQIGTEVDMALDPCCVSYDMDSEDEEWISSTKASTIPSCNNMPEVTEDTFERAMDMFEKLAYTQRSDELTDDDIETYMADVGPAETIKVIYEHWKQKRKRKGMPLIRQFQPPLWERYQQQMNEWESNMSRMPILAEGWQGKGYSLKKPPMFAFCLRPRGLEIPNKGSKQRSHKKLMFTGHHNVATREQDGFHTFGRKGDGISVSEAVVSSYESSDSFHGLQSRSTFSPKDTASTESLFTNDGSDRDLRYYRNTSKKFDAFLSPGDPHGTPFSSNQRSNRNGVNRWSSDICEWSGTKQAPPTGLQRHHTDMDEFRLRDATGAAQHALNMSKLKREKAQWLLHKADLAIHRATVALMTAEAIKSSEMDIDGDG